jgi:sialic acid synthase SpsE
MRTFFIAEAGANHDRDYAKARRLIWAAASAGASAVKFQLYESKSLYSPQTPDFGVYRSIPDLIESLELPKSWLKDLRRECDDLGIEFMCTPFDERTLNDVVAAGVKIIKVSAFESTDPRFMDLVRQTGLPVIFSAGVGSSFEQVVSTISRLRRDDPDRKVTVLHCNSAYPTPVDDVNLGTMVTMIKLLAPGVGVGLSDHTEGILIPPIAVACGASVIEKHYTLDRKSKGPDHPFAIEPDELHRLCRNIEDVEKAFGSRSSSGTTGSEESGQTTMAMRSVVTTRRVSSGEVVSRDNVSTMRPRTPGSVSAERYYEVISGEKKFVQDLDMGTILMEKHIQ